MTRRKDTYYNIHINNNINFFFLLYTIILITFIIIGFVHFKYLHNKKNLNAKYKPANFIKYYPQVKKII